MKSVSRTGGHTVANAYEANRNILLNKNNHTGNPASPVSKYDYALTGTPTAGANSLGQRKNLTTTGSAFTTAPAYTWSYNAAGELTQADDTSTASNDRAYQYDGIGNRQKTVNGLASTLGAAPVNYIANAQNQYTTANGTVLPTAPTPAPYDQDGNMTAGPLPASDTGTNATLLWDAENRLVSVTVTANSLTSTTNYSYDAQSRRTVKQPVGGTATHYIYDSWNIIAEYTGTTLNKSYTWGMDLSGSMQGAGGVGGLLALKEGTTTYYPTYDGNGNISEYLDSSNAVQAHYEYDAFGNTIVATGTKKDDFSHRFSTKPLDAETGLYYYGYRYYDATVGRWINRDPIEEYGGINLYGFVYNSLLSWIDYLGWDPIPSVWDKVARETQRIAGKAAHEIISRSEINSRRVNPVKLPPARKPAAPITRVPQSVTRPARSLPTIGGSRGTASSVASATDIFADFLHAYARRKGINSGGEKCVELAKKRMKQDASKCCFCCKVQIVADGNAGSGKTTNGRLWQVILFDGKCSYKMGKAHRIAYQTKEYKRKIKNTNFQQRLVGHGDLLIYDPPGRGKWNTLQMLRQTLPYNINVCSKKK